jgi:hypothetical protein
VAVSHSAAVELLRKNYAKVARIARACEEGQLWAITAVFEASMRDRAG